jgi:hypothetical protein
MGEEPLGKHLIGLQDTINIVQVNTHGYPHKHVLGTFGNLPIELEEVGFLQRLEAKVIEFKVTIVNHGSVQQILVGHDDIVDFLADKGGGLPRLGMGVVVKRGDDIGEDLLGFLVEVGDFDACGQDGIVGVLGGEGGGGLGGQFVEFGGGDSGVNSLDYLLGDDCFVDELR